MRIQSFHIDAFGLLRDQSVDSLPVGTAVFLGNNEAGKSTLLDFFRAVLTGYQRGSRTKAYITGQARFGGSLTLDTARGIIRVTRRPGRGDGLLTVTDATGASINSDYWSGLFGGVSHNVYASIYGFSLSELQSFQSLSTEEIRNALYGASFGMGMHSLNTALKELDAHLNDLFKKHGSKQKIQEAVNTWENLCQRIDAGERELAQYDSLVNERTCLEQQLDQARKEQRLQERERSGLKRRLDIWGQWEKWRETGVRLDLLEQVPMPEDGYARLVQIRTVKSDAQQALDRAKTKAQGKNAELAACHVDEQLLELAGRIRELSEGTLSCRKALADLPKFQARLENLKTDIAKKLGLLGPKWPLERVQTTVCSLVVREEVVQHGQKLQFAIDALTHAQQKYATAEADLTSARKEYANCTEELANLPLPENIPDKTERDLLRVHIDNVEDACSRISELERNYTEAVQDFERELQQLDIADECVLVNIADMRDAATATAQKIYGAHVALQQASNTEADALRDRQRRSASIENLEQKIQNQGRCDPVAVKENKLTLRQLRAALGQLPAAESALAGVERQLTLRTARIHHPKFSTLLFFTASLFVCAAAVAGVNILQLLPLKMPLPNDPQLAVFVAGAGFFLFGTGMVCQHTEKYLDQEVKSLQAQRTQQQERCVTIRNRIEQFFSSLLATTGMEETEPDLPVEDKLDALEEALELEQERCHTVALLREELKILKEHLQHVDESLQEAQKDRAQKDVQWKDLHRQWQDLFINLGIASPPLPENVNVFYALVDKALLTLSTVQEKQRRYAGEKQKLTVLAEKIRQLQEIMSSGESTVSDNLPKLSDTASLFASGRALLDAIDEIADRRTQLLEQYAQAQKRLQQCSAAEMQARECLDKANQHQQTCVAEWRGLLHRIGLLESDTAEPLSPETAHSYLEYIDQVKTLADDCHKCQEDIYDLENERNRILIPLRDILTRLGRLPQQPEETLVQDDTAVLDLLAGLVQDLEEAVRQAEKQRHLRQIVGEQKDEILSAQAKVNTAERDLAQLLDTVKAKDIDEFLRKYDIWKTRQDIQQRRENLEAALRLAAIDSVAEAREKAAAASTAATSDAQNAISHIGTEETFSEEAFKTFLSGFASWKKDEMTAKYERLSKHIEQLENESTRLTSEIGKLNGKIEVLLTSDALQRARVEASGLAANIYDLSREWAKYALAKQLIVEARSRFEREHQPKVLQVASRLFAGITAGKWTGISASLEDQSLRVLPQYGEPVAPEFLSRGTREQLYLTLRLAHIRTHVIQEVSLPVIMDDILVNFDPVRARRTAKVLGELNTDDAFGPGHQLLFFTCQPQTARLLLDTIPGSRLYCLENGRISVSTSADSL